MRHSLALAGFVVAVLAVASSHVVLRVMPLQTIATLERRLEVLEVTLRVDPALSGSPPELPGLRGIQSGQWSLFDGPTTPPGLVSYGPMEPGLHPEASASASPSWLALRAHTRSGTELPGHLRTFVREAGPGIEAIRARLDDDVFPLGDPTSIGRWEVESAEAMALVALAYARDQDANECLSIAVDVVRMGRRFGTAEHPFLVWRGLEYSFMSQSTVLDCAARASSSARREALSSLVTMIEENQSVGRLHATWEVAFVERQLGRTRSSLASDYWFALRSAYGEDLWAISHSLDAATAVLRGVARDASSSMATDSVAVVESLTRERLDIMSLAQMAVAMCAYQDAAEGVFPETPECLKEQWARDPFSGEELSWSRDADGRGAGVGSMGPPLVYRRSGSWRGMHRPRGFRAGCVWPGGMSEPSPGASSGELCSPGLRIEIARSNRRRDPTDVETPRDPTDVEVGEI